MSTYAIAPFPDDYPGKHIWFTLRFAAPVTTVPSIAFGNFVWGSSREGDTIEGMFLPWYDARAHGGPSALVFDAVDQCQERRLPRKKEPP